MGAELQGMTHNFVFCLRSSLYAEEQKSWELLLLMAKIVSPRCLIERRWKHANPMQGLLLLLSHQPHEIIQVRADSEHGYKVWFLYNPISYSGSHFSPLGAFLPALISGGLVSFCCTAECPDSKLVQDLGCLFQDCTTCIAPTFLLHLWGIEPSQYLSFLESLRRW